MRPSRGKSLVGNACCLASKGDSIGDDLMGEADRAMIGKTRLVGEEGPVMMGKSFLTGEAGRRGTLFCFRVGEMAVEGRDEDGVEVDAKVDATAATSVPIGRAGSVDLLCSRSIEFLFQSGAPMVTGRTEGSMGAGVTSRRGDSTLCTRLRTLTLPGWADPPGEAGIGVKLKVLVSVGLGMTRERVDVERRRVVGRASARGCDLGSGRVSFLAEKEEAEEPACEGRLIFKADAGAKTSRETREWLIELREALARWAVTVGVVDVCAEDGCCIFCGLHAGKDVAGSILGGDIAVEGVVPLRIPALG